MRIKFSKLDIDAFPSSSVLLPTHPVNDIPEVSQKAITERKQSFLLLNLCMYGIPT